MKKRKENYNRSSRVFSHYRKKTEFFKRTSPTKTIPKMSRAVVTPAWVIPPLRWLWPPHSSLMWSKAEASDANSADTNLVCRCCWSLRLASDKARHIPAGWNFIITLFTTISWLEFLWSHRCCKDNTSSSKCRKNIFFLNYATSVRDK